MLSYAHNLGYGNIQPIGRYLDPLLSCSPYTLYTVQFQFTEHLLQLLNNVPYDWLFPHQVLLLFCNISQ